MVRMIMYVLNVLAKLTLHILCNMGLLGGCYVLICVHFVCICILSSQILTVSLAYHELYVFVKDQKERQDLMYRM